MGKRGKEYRPTAAEKEFVRFAVMSGTSQAAIAELMGIAVETLKKHFRADLLTARQQLINAATKTLYEAATDDRNVDAAKFILARAGKWTEAQKIDHTSSDGTMTPPPATIIVEAGPMPGTEPDPE